MSHPPEPTIYDIAQQFRAQIAAREAAASGRLLRAYGEAWQHLQGRIDRYTQQMASADAAGVVQPVGWFHDRVRLQQLQHDVERQIGEFSQYATGQVLIEQRAAIDAAQRGLRTMILSGLPPESGAYYSFASLHQSATEHMVGHLADGSPLADLLAELGPDAAKAVGTTLTTAVAAQVHPTQAARMLREQLGGNLTRALTISRTEILRSYRSAQSDTLRANADVVDGWVWVAASDCCAVCGFEDGGFHGLDEAMDEHPRGRCVMASRSKPWTELYRDWGLDPARAPREPVAPRMSGSERFAQRPARAQLAALGPGKFALYQNGTIELQDVAKHVNNGRWGSSVAERSIPDAIAHAQHRGHYATAAAD